jgi:hypothetical protein
MGGRAYERAVISIDVALVVLDAKSIVLQEPLGILNLLAPLMGRCDCESRERHVLLLPVEMFVSVVSDVVRTVEIQTI